MGKKEKINEIKVPVYCSQIIDEQINLFGGSTQQSLINSVKEKLDKYEASPYLISNNKRNKTIRREIGKIVYYEKEFRPNSPVMRRVSAALYAFSDSQSLTGNIIEANLH